MTIAKKHAASYMPNGEVSLEQVIQAAIDEATEIRKQEVALILTGARKRIRQLESERVPEGWKLVPIEATPEMIYAMDSFSEMCFDQFGRDADTDEFYRAAIHAAPQPKKEGE